jgi:hypothetical protein
MNYIDLSTQLCYLESVFLILKLQFRELIIFYQWYQSIYPTGCEASIVSDKHREGEASIVSAKHREGEQKYQLVIFLLFQCLLQVI